VAVAVDPLAPPLPRELQVEVTGACNLACRMCLVRYRPKLGKRQGAMCFHTFRDIVDELPGLEKLTLQGLGEPLLAPDFFRMVEYSTGRGISTGFNTNGTLLTRAASERLVRAGVDWLHVSLDGATAATYESVRDRATFERVVRNIRELVAVRGRRGSERPEIQLVFVAMRRNLRELPDLVALAADIGVDSVWVQNLSHSFGDTESGGGYRGIRAFTEAEALWNEPDEEVVATFARAVERADELGLELRLPRLEEPVVEREPGEPACHWPFESAYVTHDARVQPCCMVMGADRAVLGDAKDGFAEVWRSEEYRAFRGGLVGDAEPPDVCSGCSLYRRLF
jgi:radical SAM protein with 4Fe4S-binding SPASM domain